MKRARRRTAVPAARRAREWFAVAILLAVSPRTAVADDLALPLDEPGAGWDRVVVVGDGAAGRAASFREPLARIDAGPCPARSTEPFTLFAAIRTRDPGFSSALMAREEGGAVAMSLVMGREPGRVSFEAWSWASVRLVSRTRVDDGAWHRVEVPYDPATRRAILFVDGRAEAWADLGAGGAPGARLRLGNNIGADQPYRGDLDEVRVLRRTTHADAFARFALPTVSIEARRAALSALGDRLLPRSTSVPTDVAAWSKRRDAIRRGVLDALGLDPPPQRPPLDAVVHGTLARDGFEVQRVSWRSWPGRRATGWLWLPLPKRAGRLPAVLSPHGHWAGGAIDPVVQARAQRFAREGYVVLVPDSVHVEDVASGVSAIGAMTWNNVRALDLMLARGDVDPARVAVTGASGGGQQAMYLMAIEDRLAAAAPVCMVSYFREILLDDTAHCTCNHAPRVATVADEPEISAVFAPRPALFGSVTGDWTRDFPRHGFPEIRSVYRLLGREDAVANVHRDEGHNYARPFREAVYAFFDRVLLGRTGDAGEGDVGPIPTADLLALGPAPGAAPDRAALAREHVARRPRVDALRAVAPGLPWRVVSDASPRASRPDPGAGGWRSVAPVGPDGVPVPMLVRERRDAGEAPWIVAAFPDGMESALLAPPAWLEGAARVALVEPRYAGGWAPFRGGWRRNGIMLGRGEGYEAAHDLALACESLEPHGRVVLVAAGTLGVPALLAAHVTPRIGTVVVPDVGPRFAEDGNRLPLCPEILRFGDLPEIVASIVAPRRVVIGGASRPGDFRGAKGVVVEAAEAPLSDGDVAAAMARPR